MTNEVAMLEAGLREAEELLHDIEDYLADEAHPADGGRWEILELRQRIRAFLSHDPRPADGAE